MTGGEKFQAGLFGGYAKNLGAKKTLTSAVYARAANIDLLYRLAPRILFNSGNVRLAAEVEWTAAAYGTADAKGMVRDTETFSNLRLLGAVYYFF
jgi:hypothetical protein